MTGLIKYYNLLLFDNLSALMIKMTLCNRGQCLSNLKALSKWARCIIILDNLNAQKIKVKFLEKEALKI